MKRREFIKTSCVACMSGAALATIISSCNASQFVSGQLNNDGVLINADDFRVNNSHRSYIIVRNENLKYPICVYRFSESEYSALWMQCPHQGAEIQASGSYLQCPAHGSEFNNKGQVTTGPADRNLKTFPVTVTNNQLFIDLRKK